MDFQDVIDKIHYQMEMNPNMENDLKKVSFNPNPESGEQGAMPTCDNPQPFQICTIQGSAVVEATTTAGMFIWLPSWGEKIICWHIPQDTATQTFLTPVPIYYSTDIDLFYERYRVVAANLKIQAGTVSVTNAALSGSMNAVRAYNSIASLTGNDTNVFQIYTYENAMGLSPDPTDKVGGVPSWKGVALLYVSSPDTDFGRLEDSVVYDPQDTDTTQDVVKFTNSTQNYDLNAGTHLSGSALTISLPLNTPKRTNMGKFLRDSIRASVISWDVAIIGDFASIISEAISQYQKVTITIGYENADLTGTVVNTGTMYKETFSLPITDAVSDTVHWSFNRSGAFPDLLNVDENSLVPPIRTTTFFIILETTFGQDLLFGATNFSMNANYPVTNGLTPGIIQQPNFVFYTGVEVGTKISVLGSARIEALPDAKTARFVTSKFRRVNFDENEAIQRILAKPAEYGVRWCVQGDQYESMMTLFTNAISIVMTEKSDPEQCFVNCLRQAVAMVENSSRESPVHEASLKSVLKKGFKGIGKIGSAAYKTVLKPVIAKEWENIKKLPASVARDIIERGLTSVAAMDNVYSPPQVVYQSQGSGTHLAASGYVPRAATRMPKYIAATRVPKKTGWTHIPEKKKEASPVKTFELNLKDVTLFPTVNFLEGDLADDEFGSAVDLFVIVDSNKVPSQLTVPTFVCPNRKTITNYSSYDKRSNISTLSVYPNKDVTLMRVQKICPSNGLIQVVSTDKPVGGRSLELAMYMFNNNIFGGTVYTGAIEAGNILPLADSMLKLKKAFCTKQGLLSCGNGCFDISADKVIALLTLMRQQVTPLRSRSHYNAGDSFNMLKYDIPEVAHHKFYLTPLSTVEFPQDELDALVFSSYPERVLVITNCEPPSQEFSIKDKVWYRPDKKEIYLCLNIKSMHDLNKQILHDKWWTPMPLEILHFPHSPNGVPVAATKNVKRVAATTIPNGSSLYEVVGSLTMSPLFQEIVKAKISNAPGKQLRSLYNRFEELAHSMLAEEIRKANREYPYTQKELKRNPKDRPIFNNKAIKAIKSKFNDRLSFIFGDFCKNLTNDELINVFSGYKSYLAGTATDSEETYFLAGRALPVQSDARQFLLSFPPNYEAFSEWVKNDVVFRTSNWQKDNSLLPVVTRPSSS